jgi:hypothetical protein
MASFRTRLGGEEFTRWLVPPLDRALDLAAVRGRTADLQALVANQDLREEVALLGEPEQDVDGSALVAWAAGPPIQVSAVWRRLALVVGVGVVPALWAWFAGYGLSPLLVVATLQAVIGQITRSAVRAIESGGSERVGDLMLLAGMTAVGERSSAGLESVAGQLEEAGSKASDRLAGLATRLRWSAEARYHAVLAPLAFLVGGRLHAAHAIEAWRTAHGGRLETWLAAVGRLDALVGLSAWGFENPECTSAEIVEDDVVLDAKGVGHPLLSDSDCVRNDVQLDAEHPLLLISGSNMSGKSTLLRSVGVNVVLGLAGLPVRAERFVTSPFALGASIQIHDSLRAGRSHFEAELRRLHALDDLSTGDRPLLYLLDEVLAGTNSHDRALGAEAVLTALTARGAVGLVTTHDLALTTLVDRLEPAPRNFHFRDHVSDGKMAFDYRLRAGVVPRGNALALMRVLGFDV